MGVGIAVRDTAHGPNWELNPKDESHFVKQVSHMQDPETKKETGTPANSNAINY